MKVIMYGTAICPDCVEAKELLKKESNIELDYRNISENISILKEFLSYRDHDEMFAPIKEKGKVGIPFFILEDGTKTLDLSDIVEVQSGDIDQVVNSCSIDGKGNC